MEVVYDPNQQQQGGYMPQQTAYDPQQQQYNPQQQPAAAPQQQPVAQPQQQQQYSQPAQQTMAQPQPQYQQPAQQQYQQPAQQQPQAQNAGWPQQGAQAGGWPQQGAPRGNAPQGGHPQAQPVVKLQCTRKMMERKNLLIMDGYINNVRVTQAPDGSISRVGFLLAWEAPTFQDGQQVFNADGTPVTRDVRFAMSAWGAVAQALAALPIGTPITVKANANRWNSARQGEQANWQTDFRVNQFEVL